MITALAPYSAAGVGINPILTCLHGYVLALRCSSLVAASSSIIMLFACDCSARVCISFISLFAAAAPFEAFYDAGAPINFLVALLTLTAFYCYSIELNCVKV